MIKIEVTGNSIGEVADKLLAIGRSLHNTSVNAADDAAREALQAQRDAAKAGVAEGAPSPEPVREEPASTAPTEASATPTAEKSSAELNFDTDVAPYVLQVVKEKGKPVAQEILDQFGVEKASLLDRDRWPELVSMLKAAL